MSLKSSRSFSSLLEGSFLSKSKKNLNLGSDNSLDYKSSFGFVIKDFEGNIKSSELGCSTGEQVSILAFINEYKYICKNSNGKVGIIPTEYLNLDTVSKFEVPIYREYKAEVGISDLGFANFVHNYEEKLKLSSSSETRIRSISQPTTLEIKLENSLATEKSVKVGTLQKNDNLIVSVIGDDEIKKIIIEEAWTLADINNFVFKKFKIAEIEKYQLFVLNHNNNMVSMNDFLLAGLRNDIKTEKNIYLRKRHSPKSKHLQEGTSESSPNLQERATSKTGSFMGKSKKNNTTPGFTTPEVKNIVALLTKEFQGKGAFHCNKGDQVTILAVIDAKFYVCRKSNELIDAIPVQLLYIQNSKVEIPSIEQYQKNNMNNDPNFSEFYLQYAGNSFIDINDSDAENSTSLFRSARKRSRSQPMSFKSTYGDLKLNGFASVKVGKSNTAREIAKLITFSISGDNGENKKVVIDSDFTLLQSVALVYEAFGIKETLKYQLLIIDNSCPTELNDKIFARFKSDPLYDKPLYLKKKPNQIERLEPIDSEIETSTPTSSSLTPPTRESILSTASSISRTDSITIHRGSTDTTSSISSNADSIFNGMVFKVVNKGVRGPPIPNLNDGGIEIQTVVKGRLLGKGNSASVYLGMNSKTGKSIAIKEIDLSLKFPTSLHKNTVLDVLKRETLFLRKLQHEHIVEYYGFNLIDDKLQLLLECVPGGTLKF